MYKPLRIEKGVLRTLAKLTRQNLLKLGPVIAAQTVGASSVSLFASTDAVRGSELTCSCASRSFHYGDEDI